MAIQTILTNSVQPLGLPNTGSSVEQGDTWDSGMAKANAMFVEIYGGAAPQTAGAGAATFKTSGNIQKSVTTIGSSATNTTQTMISYSLPANTLSAVGAGIWVTAWGRKANNAAPVTLALAVGGKNINTGSSNVSGGVTWIMEAEAYKNGASSQQELYTAQINNVFTAPVSTSDTSTDTAAITIAVQALDASAAQSNVLLDGFVVEFFG